MNDSKEITVVKKIKEMNTLFPVFLKLENLQLLIVGGGAVGLEKLKALLNNSPATQIKVVADSICEEIIHLADRHKNIELNDRVYQSKDLNDCDLVIVAVTDKRTSSFIQKDAKEKGILINVADIIYADTLPDQVDDLLGNTHLIRNKLNGNFAEEIIPLNKLTETLVVEKEKSLLPLNEKQWRRIASYSLFAFVFMFLGHLILSYIPISNLVDDFKIMVLRIDSSFYWMIAAGFLAQLVDGLLGMGYGVTCTTVLLSLGINLPTISGSIHTAEMFSSGVSGYSHYKFGNVNKKLFRKLLIPGIVGAVAGAYLLSKFGNQYAFYIRPMLAVYTLFLGTKILRAAFQKNRIAKKVKRVGWLAGAGGFLDSFGGGGWGPLVTSTLISKGRSPNYVIGSVSITEFFVTLASALTFFSMLGINHWPVILGLMVGGTLAAPFAARLAGKLPVKSMFVGVGGLVIVWSVVMLSKFFLG